jgi:hypothetical protein
MDQPGPTVDQPSRSIVYQSTCQTCVLVMILQVATSVMWPFIDSVHVDQEDTKPRTGG